MISIDRVQIILFVFAILGIVGVTLCVAFDFDEFSLALGAVCGWVLGASQTANHMIIETSKEQLKVRAD